MVVCRAQTYPITQNLGSPNTLVKNPNYGAIQGGLVPFSFSDTTSANTSLTYGKNYNGFLIWTTSPPAMWYRSATLNKWVQLIPGADTSALSSWLTTGNLNVPTDINLNAIMGTLGGNGIKFTTNNTTRLILPAAGLTFNQVVGDTTLNKVLTYNTSTKDIGYGYWYGGSGATPTWQQTLTAGSTLSGANTITGGGVLTFEDQTSFNVKKSSVSRLQITAGSSSIRSASTEASLLLTGSTAILTGNVQSTVQSTGGDINVYADSITIHPPIGTLFIDTLNYSSNADDSMMVWRASTGLVGMRAVPSGGITVGTTTITSGTNTKILYNNSGVLGEYTISGSGNVAMTTSAALTTPTVATSIAPNSNDGAALGTTALQFSDLFLASGGVINWANGNTTLTQTSGALTLAGSFYSTGSVAAGTYLYGGDKYNTYAGYSGAVLGGISTHGVLDFIDNNNRIGEFYTDASNFNFFTDAGKGIVFYVNNSFTAPAMQFTSAGALRLGYLGAGALTADASGNITSVSDERLKDIQGYYGVGLNQVMKISPIVYKWNEKSGLDREHNYIGFSAQNIENNLGENAIGVNHDGYKSIQDRAIMAAMVNSIKDLKNLNDAQQKEINDLKKEVKKLKNP